MMFYMCMLFTDLLMLKVTDLLKFLISIPFAVTDLCEIKLMYKCSKGECTNNDCIVVNRLA